MARLTAAAAGLVCAALLRLVVLGSAGAAAGGGGVLPDELLPYASFFPDGLPPPVRIYCRQNIEKNYLNVAIRDNKVVLVKANQWDKTQLWIPLPFFGAVKPFSLMNAKTYQVIVIPKGGSKLQLSERFDLVSATKELWLPAAPRSDHPEDLGFYQVKVYADQGKALNGLWGNAHEGTEVGFYSANPVTQNTLWLVSSAWPLPLHFP
ncbi:hypothetical protein ACP4OV_011142 [Aristida adscensionis]